MLAIARHVSEAPAAFRLIGLLLGVVPPIFLLLASQTFASGVVAFAIGALLSVLGWAYRQREPLIAGALLSVAGGFVAALSALASLDVNTWISLGTGGVVLVLLASAFERYGRVLVVRMGDGLEEVAAWKRAV